MTTRRPEDEQRGKRRGPRLSLDWLKAEWSPSTGFKITVGGVVGVAVAVVVWLTAGGEPHADGPKDPKSTTATPSPTTTTTSTTTTTTAGRPLTTPSRPGQIVPPPAGTITTSSPATTEPSSPPPELVQLGAGWVEQDPSRQDCAADCQFDFFQDITMTKPGTLTYRWEFSDNATTKPAPLTFDTPGTRTVTTSWQRWGNPGDKLDGGAWIHILTPVDLNTREDRQLHYEYVYPAGPG
jgi:hypothetical protein